MMRLVFGFYDILQPLGVHGQEDARVVVPAFSRRSAFSVMALRHTEWRRQRDDIDY